MALDLDLVRIFVKVVQNGSFSKAALLLKLPKSTVSKSISRLEKETATKLMVRTTRNLTLTAAGRGFYESSLGPVSAIEDAQRSLQGQDSIISGLVRITAPEDLGTFVIAPAVAELTLKYPKLSYELHYTNEIVDLVKDGFDFAIRIGRPTESSFKIKKVGDISLITVASPKYLKGKKKIQSPKDLETLECLSLSDRAYISRWALRSQRGAATVAIHPKISSNQMSSILKCALAAGGIALVPYYLCKSELESGKLIHVLPEWRSSPLPVSIISPLSSTHTARLKISMEYLLHKLQVALD